MGDRETDQITSDEVLFYLNRRITEGNKPYTKRVRYAKLSSFLNFIRNNIAPESTNPCDSPMIRKIYWNGSRPHEKFLKERLLMNSFSGQPNPGPAHLELIARSEMRIGTVMHSRPVIVPMTEFFQFPVKPTRMTVLKAGKMVFNYRPSPAQHNLRHVQERFLIKADLSRIIHAISRQRPCFRITSKFNHIAGAHSGECNLFR